MSRFECPTEHKHGATIHCYAAHRCRCESCRSASNGRLGKNYRLVECGRCPQFIKQWTGKRKQTLCRDCRDVLTEQELALWVA